MKKIYESPESLTVNIGLHGRLLKDIMSQGDDGEEPGFVREHSVWDDDDEKGGKKIFDEEW